MPGFLIVMAILFCVAAMLMLSAMIVYKKDLYLSLYLQFAGWCVLIFLMFIPLMFVK